MRWSFIKALALGTLVQTVTSQSSNDRSNNLKVVRTTEYGDDIIDWVTKESQGDIASPPPAPPVERRDSGGDRPTKQPTLEELARYAAPKGPPGTVPILKAKKDLPPKRLPSDGGNDEMLTAGAASAQARSVGHDVPNVDDFGKHWYASSSLRAPNHGSGGLISIYNPYTEDKDDFSILQTAVTVESAPQANGSAQQQTVEAGLMHLESLVGGGPFLFTFFTTNGYISRGDYIGGYNQLQKGWVQHDDSMFPGMHLKPISAVNGTQYEFKVEYKLFQGNWWLYFLDRWIGYYPGWMFTQTGVNASDTLQSGSDVVVWYGEVFNNEDNATTTDMGSGHFPEDGFGKAAYIRGINVFDTEDRAYHYRPNAHDIISDPDRYRLQTHWLSGGDWGSYMYVGGPGAGGEIDG